MQESLLSSALVKTFDGLFQRPENTILRGGADEPFFSPGQPSTVFFREDFGRSALHEVAHWCVAGAIRRRLPDYGYWYAPDGRDEREQAAFFSVEVTPQAIEALFCESLGLAFTVSVDNLMISSDDPAIQIFNEAVTTKVSLLRTNGLPPRASRFNQALAALSLRV